LVVSFVRCRPCPCGWVDGGVYSLKTFVLLVGGSVVVVVGGGGGVVIVCVDGRRSWVSGWVDLVVVDADA